MQMATASYGRTIDIMGNGVTCPPDGFYNVRILGSTDPEERPGFSGGDIDVQSRLNIEIFGWKSDDDEEEDDWNGERMSMFAVWARHPGGDRNKTKALYKSAKATSGKLLRAIYPDLSDAEWSAYVLDLDDLEGREFKVFITEKANGYPNFENFTPYVRKGRKAKATETESAPARKAPVAVEDPDEDDELFDDDTE